MDNVDLLDKDGGNQCPERALEWILFSIFSTTKPSCKCEKTEENKSLCSQIPGLEQL